MIDQGCQVGYATAQMAMVFFSLFRFVAAFELGLIDWLLDQRSLGYEKKGGVWTSGNPDHEEDYSSFPSPSLSSSPVMQLAPLAFEVGGLGEEGRGEESDINILWIIHHEKKGWCSVLGAAEIKKMGEKMTFFEGQRKRWRNRD